MEVDSLSSSHPVSTPVENPTQIQEMFDDVSYDKVSGLWKVQELDILDCDHARYWNITNKDLSRLSTQEISFDPNLYMCVVS